MDLTTKTTKIISRDYTSICNHACVFGTVIITGHGRPHIKEKRGVAQRSYCYAVIVLQRYGFDLLQLESRKFACRYLIDCVLRHEPIIFDIVYVTLWNYGWA